MMEVSSMNVGVMPVDKAVNLACFMGSKGKPSGGGGRRKQSKPIRVLFDADGSSDAAGGAVVAPASGRELPEADGGSIRDGSVPVGLEAEDTVLISCDMCQDTFRSASQLSDHVLAAHNVGESGSRDPSYLTKYHQLGNELNGSIMIEGASEPDEGYADGGPMIYEPSTPPQNLRSPAQTSERASPSSREGSIRKEKHYSSSSTPQRSDSQPHHRSPSRESSSAQSIPAMTSVFPQLEPRDTPEMSVFRPKSESSPEHTANHIVSKA